MLCHFLKLLLKKFVDESYYFHWSNVASSLFIYGTPHLPYVDNIHIMMIFQHSRMILQHNMMILIHNVMILQHT